MSKRKRPAQNKAKLAAQPSPAPKQPGAPAQNGGRAEPASSAAPAASPKKVGNTGLLYVGAGMLALLLIGVAIAFLAKPNPPPTNTANGDTGAAANSTPQRRSNIGRVTACQKNPEFSSKIGLGKRVVASTSTKGYTGIVLFDADNPQRIYQHPGWDALGPLGQFVADRNGNIYVLPAMEVSMNSGAELQNKIFKVDTNSAELAPFLSVPAAGDLSAENPFGLLSLTYDCDSNSLYASTVGGSTSGAEVGRIFRIDLNSGKVAAQFERSDVVGLGVFNGAFGKRLYFGAARSPAVYSLALTDQGDFVGQARLEFTLSELPGGNDDKARRLLFTDKRELNVRAWPFDFNLRAASETPKRLYHFKYQEQDDTWQFVNAEAVTDGS